MEKSRNLFERKKSSVGGPDSGGAAPPAVASTIIMIKLTGSEGGGQDGKVWNRGFLVASIATEHKHKRTIFAY